MWNLLYIKTIQLFISSNKLLKGKKSYDYFNSYLKKAFLKFSVYL